MNLAEEKQIPQCFTEKPDLVQALSSVAALSCRLALREWTHRSFDLLEAPGAAVSDIYRAGKMNAWLNAVALKLLPPMPLHEVRYLIREPKITQSDEWTRCLTLHRSLWLKDAYDYPFLISHNMRTCDDKDVLQACLTLGATLQCTVPDWSADCATLSAIELYIDYFGLPPKELFFKSWVPKLTHHQYLSASNAKVLRRFERYTEWIDNHWTLYYPDIPLEDASWPLKRTVPRARRQQVLSPFIRTRYHALTKHYPYIHRLASWHNDHSVLLDPLIHSTLDQRIECYWIMMHRYPEEYNRLQEQLDLTPYVNTACPRALITVFSLNMTWTEARQHWDNAHLSSEILDLPELE